MNLTRRHEIKISRKGEWRFRCRRCKTSYVPHYFHVTALADRDTHRVEGCR